MFYTEHGKRATIQIRRRRRDEFDNQWCFFSSGPILHIPTAPGGTYPWEGGPVASSTAAAAVAAAAAAAAVTAAGGGAGSRQVPLRPMTTFSGHLTGGQRPSHQQTVGAKRGVTGAAGDAVSVEVLCRWIKWV